jgi:glycosyltransferase involved in cell wall biosynthesis
MDLSLIIPVYNEENLQRSGAICNAVKPLGRSWEVLFIDDGSTDESLSILRQLAEQEPESVRVIVFRRNFGQTAAIAAGLDNSRGEIIILMDADLQNDPEDIPKLLDTLDEGYDVVASVQAPQGHSRVRCLP